MPHIAGSMRVKGFSPIDFENRFISAAFFTYCENGVTKHGVPNIGHIRCTSSNNSTSNSSSDSAFSPRFTRLAFIAACIPFRSAISEPIMPPGNPQPTSSEVIFELRGSIQ